MRLADALRQRADGVGARAVGVVAVEVTSKISHDRHALAQRGTVGADREGRVHTGPAEREIVGRGRLGVVARQHAAHEDLHPPAEGAEDPQAAVQAQCMFQRDREVEIGHAAPVERGEGGDHAGMLPAPVAQAADLVGGLDGADGADGVGTVDQRRAGKAGAEPEPLGGGQRVALQRQPARQRTSGGGEMFGNLLGASHGDRLEARQPRGEIGRTPVVVDRRALRRQVEPTVHHGA